MTDNRIAPMLEWMNREVERNKVLAEGAAALQEFANLDSTMEAKQGQIKTLKAEHEALQQSVALAKAEQLDAEGKAKRIREEAERGKEAILVESKRVAETLLERAKADADQTKAAVQQQLHAQRVAQEQQVKQQQNILADLRTEIEQAQQALAAAKAQHDDVHTKTKQLRELASSIATH